MKGRKIIGKQYKKVETVEKELANNTKRWEQVEKELEHNTKL